MLMTNRCELRVLSERDYESVMLLYANEDVRKYLGGTVDVESYQIRFQMMLDSSHYWTVHLKETKEFIGLVFLDKCHDLIHTVIGFQFLPAYWGKGYAREAVEKVIGFGLTSLHLPAIVAETQTLNVRSCNLLKKVGMKLDNTIDRFGEQLMRFQIGACHRPKLDKFQEKIVSVVRSGLEFGQV